MKKSLWIFIGRMNPPHIWHISVIKKALEKNTKVLILLWSNWKINSNNPLNFEIRKFLLEKCLLNKNLDIKIIEDILDDIIWVENIWKIVKKFYKNYNINFYGWDFKNDSAIKVIRQYEKELLVNNKIKYVEINRNDNKIKYNWKYISISSTNLRKALFDKDYDLINMLVSNKIHEDIIKNFPWF